MPTVYSGKAPSKKARCHCTRLSKTADHFHFRSRYGRLDGEILPHFVTPILANNIRGSHALRRARNVPTRRWSHTRSEPEEPVHEGAIFTTATHGTEGDLESSVRNQRR